MKNSILAIILICSVCFSSAFAMDPVSPITKSELRKEVMKLLNIDQLSAKNIDDQEIKINFIVTATNQIVVTSVDTKNSYLDEYCKNHLNYKALKTSGIVKSENYHINLKFQ